VGRAPGLTGGNRSEAPPTGSARREAGAGRGGMNEFPHSPRARATASGADSLTARAVAVGFEPEHLGAYIRVDSDLGEEGGDGPVISSTS